MEEPDFDDLIEEDMEMAQPPPSYDEEMLLEAMMAEADAAETQHRVVRAEAEAPPQTSMAQTPDLSQDDISATSESTPARGGPSSVSPTRDSSTRVRQSFYNSKREKEFSFERFNHKSNWRQEKRDNSPRGSTMRAKEWKPSTTVPERKPVESPDVFPSSSDAQILHYAKSHNSRQRFFSGEQLSKGRKKMGSTNTDIQSRPRAGMKAYAMTLGDGTQIFLHDTRLENASSSSQVVVKQRATDTLGLSMTQVMRRVDASRRRKEHARRFDKDDRWEGSSENKENVDHRLWVDKHAPTSFAHLLSDERTNREVVRALRAWDPYVFQQKPPPRPLNDFGRNNTEVKEKPEKASNLKDTRPEESKRVILLSGPPGAGKSTLAHIVARHCGYRPIEVNGSDERSATALKDRVLRTMESNTLDLSGGAEKSRPTCLILDEIDGADAGGAIQSLVDIIRAEIPSKGMNKTKSPYLRRPIIFICNNKYVPALRPLLSYCAQFPVAPTSATKLATRLRAVLALEKLSVSSGLGLIQNLIVSSGGDIRSCLYTLQFAAAKAVESARSKSRGLGTSSNIDISKELQGSLSGQGLKDSRTDATSSVLKVFKKEKKRNIGRLQYRNDSSSSSSDGIIDLVQSSGEGSRILDSIFINIPKISTVDPTFDRYATVVEILSRSDMYRSHTTHAAQNNSSEMFSMQSKYIPCGAAAVHVLCRLEKRQELIFTNRELIECKFQMEANLALTHRFVESLSPHASSIRCPGLVPLETSPYVLWILSAGNGSITLDRIASSINLLSPAEQIAFDNHVSILRALGLTYVLSSFNENQKWLKQSELNESVRLEPAIDRFTIFESLEKHDERREIPAVMKGLLAQKASFEDIRKSPSNAKDEKKLEKEEKEAPKTTKPPESESTTSKSEEVIEKQKSVLQTENHKKNLRDLVASTLPPPKRAKTNGNFLRAQAERAKAAKSRRKRARVGMDRSKTKKQTTHTGSDRALKNVIRLRYVKGFTQAVRVPCNTEDIV